MLHFTITADDHCRRLESWLQRLLPAASPAYLRKLIKSGACRLNDAATAPDQLLCCHDGITLKESGAVEQYLRGAPAPLDLLWQDSRLLVVNKQAGLAMHPAAEVHENLVDIASAWLEKRSNHPARAYPVNRLDRGTSGVVLLAASSSCAGMLGRQVKETGLDKRYLTVVEGCLEGADEISLPLDGKESVSRYRCLAAGNDATLMQVEPVTGRTHQIRRHLAAIGHPVLGDTRYDGTLQPLLPGIALHSFRTVLQYPDVTGSLVLCAPLPAALRILICDRCSIAEADMLELLHHLVLTPATL